MRTMRLTFWGSADRGGFVAGCSQWVQAGQDQVQLPRVIIAQAHMMFHEIWSICVKVMSKS